MPPPPPAPMSLPPPPLSAMPQPAFVGANGVPRPPPPGSGRPPFNTGYGAAPPQHSRQHGGRPGLPPPYGLHNPSPPPMPPSGTSLIDDILGKKSIKDRQQTEKCALTVSSVNSHHDPDVKAHLTFCLCR